MPDEKKLTDETMTKAIDEFLAAISEEGWNGDRATVILRNSKTGEYRMATTENEDDLIRWVGRIIYGEVEETGHNSIPSAFMTNRGITE